jgi:hypothetical protein
VAGYNKRLKRAMNEQKKQAAGFLIAVADLKYPSGKPKIGPAMTKITAARSRLSKRPGQIANIGGFNAKDRIVLNAQLARQKRDAEGFRDELAAATADVHAGKNPEEARRRIVFATKRLEKIDLKPMRLGAEVLRGQADALESDDVVEMKHDLKAMRAAGKLQALATSLNELRLDCATYGRILYAKTLRSVEDMERAFNEGENTGEPKDELDELAKPLRFELKRTRKGLEYYLQWPPSEEDAAKKRDDFLKYLKTIDTETPMSVIAERTKKSPYAAGIYTLTESRTLL